MTTVLEQLRQLADEHKWDEILALKPAATSMVAPSTADRALAFHILGRAHWNLSRDEFDLAQSIRYARDAAAFDPLGGLPLKQLGIRLATIGRYHDGRRALQKWVARFNEWTPQVQAGLVDVQYALGYAARYEGDLHEAELWYGSALDSFQNAGNEEWVYKTTCALAQVVVRTGRFKTAALYLQSLPNTPKLNGYRLKAMAELLAASGDATMALGFGNQAAEQLLELDWQDPWELAELHLLLANIHDLAGNPVERERHAEAARDALYISPRHTLYRAACMLLDHISLKEVIA